MPGLSVHQQRKRLDGVAIPPGALWPLALLTVLTLLRSPRAGSFRSVRGDRDSNRLTASGENAQDNRQRSKKQPMLINGPPKQARWQLVQSDEPRHASGLPWRCPGPLAQQPDKQAVCG